MPFAPFFIVFIRTIELKVQTSTVNPEDSPSLIRYLQVNPLNAELNPICYLLALLAHHFPHVSRIRVKSLTLRLLMSYIYIYIYIERERERERGRERERAPILDVSRSHTTTQRSR